ncbi:hypothetical protein WJX72_011183 [[Myrmecia] bisecta]|uniref:BolA-like protein n=1 Tax=[Myrmecia] bisecta TaxID=41462 RepID=A0AAW1PGY6_9CHLO
MYGRCAFREVCSTSHRTALPAPSLRPAAFNGGPRRGDVSYLQRGDRHTKLQRGLKPLHAEPEQAQVVPAELMESMKAKISEALATEEVDVTDTYGDGRHVSIDVVADSFEGLSSVARQRLVYKAIWMELQGAVHAVDALITRTPAEAGR